MLHILHSCVHCATVCNLMRVTVDTKYPTEQWARLLRDTLWVSLLSFVTFIVYLFLAHFSSALYPLCGCSVQLPHLICCCNIFVYLILYLLSLAWATLLLSYCVRQIIKSWLCFCFISFFLLLLTDQNTPTGLAFNFVIFDSILF